MAEESRRAKAAKRSASPSEAINSWRRGAAQQKERFEEELGALPAGLTEKTDRPLSVVPSLWYRIPHRWLQVSSPRSAACIGAGCRG